MEQQKSFYKIYIFCFTDFNSMLNKNSKQNIVNSMWREDLKGLYIYKTCDKRVLEYISNIHKKAPVLDSPFNKVAGLKACNFIEMRIYRKCFPVNIVKFLRTYFEEHLLTTASEKTKSQQIKSCVCKKSTKI